MQNRYLGDVGDFGKYGLLRALCGSGETQANNPLLRLGVVWYLHPDESHNRDGKHIGYLSDTPKNHAAFRACDPSLYDAMRSLVAGDRRRVSQVRTSGILPQGTAYYERSLIYENGTSTTSRQVLRDQWLGGALETTVEADAVFVDPDNGMSQAVSPLRKHGPKYVHMDDLRAFARRGQSLIIYHHLGRRGSAEEQIRNVADTLHTNLNLHRPPLSLQYRRGTARAYFVIAQEKHESLLEDRLTTFLASPWRAHFELVR